MSHFKTSLSHIRRSPYQALSAIMVMALTFFISGTLVLIGFGSNVILKWFETRPQVTAFFKDEVTPDQIDNLKARINQTGKVREMKYVTKEEALNLYKDLTKGEPLLQEMVTASLLPASLEISTNEVNGLKEIAEILKADESVDDVIFPEDVVSSLSNLTNALRQIGIAIIVFIALVSVLEILVMISMKIAIKKDEIEILRLIGASSWYVRMPFIYEGMFYGVGGAIIGWLGSYVLLMYSTPFLVSYFSEINLFPIPTMVMGGLLGGMILFGTIIGALGSFIAVKRYLR